MNFFCLQVLGFLELFRAACSPVQVFASPVWGCCLESPLELESSLKPQELEPLEESLPVPHSHGIPTPEDASGLPKPPTILCQGALGHSPLSRTGGSRGAGSR
ncbi:hypothetical protein IHE44_0007604 [Lamprotornis superbus]|uniref:Secreted protein n=1 Tax=Lamprotornis superbus TaxID=245042 RepID=A0A835TUG6_9PASS|nr:hypothetical protein IHE44_0007604 [Lamprotornis superbus]